MSYIRLADLQYGMGEVTSDQVAVEIARLQQQLVGVQANIANFERQASALRSSQPQVAASFDQNARALRSAETALNQQIATKQQLQAQLQAQEAQSRQAMLQFAGQITGAAANVGTAVLASEQARKAARDEARLRLAEANRPVAPTIMQTGAPDSGMSTGAMIAIGVVGTVVVVGGLAMVAMNKPAPAQTRNSGTYSCKKCGERARQGTTLRHKPRCVWATTKRTTKRPKK